MRTLLKTWRTSFQIVNSFDYDIWFAKIASFTASYGEFLSIYYYYYSIIIFWNKNFVEKIICYIFGRLLVRLRNLFNTVDLILFESVVNHRFKSPELAIITFMVIFINDISPADRSLQQSIQ